MKHWIAAFRLRTLPLAFSSIIMGSFVAAYYNGHKPVITILCIVTTLFLQILSNLSNDYGDFEHGADNDERIGPERTMQSGKIAKESMKSAIMIFMLLSLASGISLLYIAFSSTNVLMLLCFLGLGMAAIWAAYNYTAGKNPYGYRAMGDVFVFLFFGLVAVGGTFYLHTQQWDWLILLPASASGLMAVGVLNINNTRDLDSDKNAGKITIPVLIGPKAARHYQMVIIDFIFVLLAAFVYLAQEDIMLQDFVFLLAYIPFMIIGIGVLRKPAEALDPYLKKMAMTSLFTTLLFGWCILA